MRSRFIRAFACDSLSGVAELHDGLGERQELRAEFAMNSSAGTRRKARWYAKVILVLIGFVLALALGEAGLALHDRFFRWSEFRKTIDFERAAGEHEIGIAVLGGSTAQGSPTVGFSMGLSLQGMLKSRCGVGSRLQVCATGGWALEDAMRRWWRDASERPDVMIVYSGHNQLFRYYPPDMKPPPMGWLGHLRTGRLLLHRLCSRQLYAEHRQYTGGFFCDTPIPWYELESGLADYRAQLELLIRHCRQNDILPVLVVPASNYVMPPNRSHYDGPAQRRDEALHLFKQVCYSKYVGKDDDAALALLEKLAGFCSFAHLHYELGEIYYRRGRTDEASEQLALARDLDGYWIRMPEQYRQVVAEVAAEHDVPVVDMHRVVVEKLARPVPDNEVFYDHVHFTPDAYMALEEEILEVLLERRVAGLKLLPQRRPLSPGWTERTAVSAENRAAILAHTMQEVRTAAGDEAFLRHPFYRHARERLKSIPMEVLPPEEQEFVVQELEQLEVVIAEERQRMLLWIREVRQ